jgi:hypothetical protein
MDTLLSTPRSSRPSPFSPPSFSSTPEDFHLGLSALIGAVLIGLWSGIAPLPWGRAWPGRGGAGHPVPRCAFRESFFSSLMRTTGRVDGMVSAYRSVVRSPGSPRRPFHGDRRAPRPGGRSSPRRW